MKKIKIFSTVIISLLLVLTVAGCSGNSGQSSSGSQSSGSKDTVFEFYDKVQLDQTKAQVDTELGVTPQASTQMENIFVYVNEDTGFGVSVMYNENGLATSKTLFYPNVEDLAFLTPKAVTQEQADSIPDGATYDEIKTILGEDGIETDATQIAFNDNKVSYIRIWANKDGSMLQAVFLTDGTTNNVMFFD